MLPINVKALKEAKERELTALVGNFLFGAPKQTDHLCGVNVASHAHNITFNALAGRRQQYQRYLGGRVKKLSTHKISSGPSVGFIA